MTKEEKKDEMKNKISMALKDPILQQGFEIICKENEQTEHLREERNYFQEKCEDIELNYYCDHKGICKVQELEKEAEEYAENINLDTKWNNPRQTIEQCFIAGAKLMQEDINKLLDVINNQDVKIADLEKQIEKMKCCSNCRYGGYTTMKCDCSEPCNNKDK